MLGVRWTFLACPFLIVFSAGSIALLTGLRIVAAQLWVIVPTLLLTLLACGALLLFQRAGRATGTTGNAQTLFLSGRLHQPCAGWRLVHRSNGSNILMPLRLTLFERVLARLNLLPVPLFDTPLAPGIAKVLVTACELGVFDALQQRPLPLETLAEQLNCQPQGLRLLLQLLVSAGYLQQHRGAYANTRVSRRWLTCSSPSNIAPYILHAPDIVAIWDHLPEVVRTNQQAMRMPYEEDPHDLATQAALARHYAGLAALAMVLGGEVINRVRLPHGAAHLLDVGGSHAAYSVLFCRKYPHLLATILDIQPGIEAGNAPRHRRG